MKHRSSAPGTGRCAFGLNSCPFTCTLILLITEPQGDPLDGGCPHRRTVRAVISSTRCRRRGTRPIRGRQYEVVEVVDHRVLQFVPAAGLPATQPPFVLPRGEPSTRTGPSPVSTTVLRLRFTSDVQVPELREGVALGDITVSIRLWQRPRVRVGGRYDSDGFRSRSTPSRCCRSRRSQLMTSPGPASATAKRFGSVRRTRAVHDDTLVYRIEFHVT